jgi:REP element-mobilizing transposase RayT
MHVLASHVIISAYGFWLPNDPRGSWSDFVGAWELLRYGRATKVTTHRSVAHVPHDRALRLRARAALKYPPVHFSPRQIESIGRGFARAASEAGYVLHACAGQHDHWHFVVARHERTVEVITGHLKSAATRSLRADRLHPFERHATPDGSVPSVWGEGLWKVFLYTDADVVRATRYVRHNLTREGLPPQHWSFVQPYRTDDLRND